MSQLSSRTVRSKDPAGAGRATDQADGGRATNLVGAWALAAAQVIRDATDGELDGSGALAAALVTVALFPGERVDALDAALGLSSSGVVRTVDRLVEAGLAERHTGVGDGREVLIHPTRRGARVADRVLAARAGAIERLLAPLTPSEREQFLGLVEKLLLGVAPDRAQARHICRLCDHPACERSWCPVSAGASGDPHRSHPVKATR